MFVNAKIAGIITKQNFIDRNICLERQSRMRESYLSVLSCIYPRLNNVFTFYQELSNCAVFHTFMIWQTKTTCLSPENHSKFALIGTEQLFGSVQHHSSPSEILPAFSVLFKKLIKNKPPQQWDYAQKIYDSAVSAQSVEFRR